MLSAAIALDECKQLVQSLHQCRQLDHKKRVSTARKEADQIESGMTGIIPCQSYQIFYWQVSLRHQDFFIYWPIPATRKYLTG
jgi:hypothetical protein